MKKSQHPVTAIMTIQHPVTVIMTIQHPVTAIMTITALTRWRRRPETASGGPGETLCRGCTNIFGNIAYKMK